MKLKNKSAKVVKANKKTTTAEKKTGGKTGGKTFSDDFSAELIGQLNKEAGSQIAFNLGVDEAPTNIKRWISTGSRQLNTILSNRIDGGLPEGRIVEIQGPTSCHGRGDKVMLYTGDLMKVEDVKVGDKLMGPDGKPRTVQEVHSGTDELYEMKPARGGKAYTVNQNHLLFLKRIPWSMGQETKETVVLSVRDYLDTSKFFKTIHKLERVEIKSFEGRNKRLPQNPIIPPYILGVLLGDGHLSEKILEGSDHDIIRKELRNLELLNAKSHNKFVPDVYKYASKKQRLELIAGLIDTDGHNNKNMNFDYVSKSKRLATDLAFVCSTVGLRATLTEKIQKYKDEDFLFYRLCISGDLSCVPTQTVRKNVTPRKTSRSSNLSGFSLTPKGEGQYYGFELDEDHLYLTDDCTVYHNSGKSHIAFEVAKATQKLGGIVVYMDTENATNLDNLEQLGIDVKHRFVFVQSVCTEEIFAVAESAIMKARAMKADVPVTIIWDSLAASSPKAELEGDYDQNSIGLQARVLGKGMRKIVNIIGNQNVLMLLINQQRKNIGVMFGDDCLNPQMKIRVRRRKTMV